MSLLQFNIHDLLWLTTLAAALAWGYHSHLARQKAEQVAVEMQSKAKQNNAGLTRRDLEAKLRLQQEVMLKMLQRPERPEGRPDVRLLGSTPGTTPPAPGHNAASGQPAQKRPQLLAVDGDPTPGPPRHLH